MRSNKISIITIGSRGDVQPYIALGKGLQDAGFTVELASGSGFEALVRGQDVPFRPIANLDVELLMKQDEVKAVLETKNPFKMLRGLRDIGRPFFDEMLDGMLDVLSDSRLCILSSLAQFGGLGACEKRGVMPVLSYLQPVIPTGQIASPFFPQLPSARGTQLYNRISHHIMIVALWQMFRPFVNEGRSQKLGLEKYPISSNWNEINKRKLPMLLAYSPTVLPADKSWSEHINVTGYWFSEEPNEWTPPAGLLDFLADGPPPVYIGFGSMSNRDPEKNTQIMVDALNKSGERGLLLTGWGGLQDTALPDNIFKIKSCPHHWLFPRMKVIVHHGGAGTTAAAFRAGKPQIVVPFFADQPFWGRTVQKLGVGAAPLPNRAISANRLAAAISQVATSETMARRASDLGKSVRAEDGVGNGVKMVAQLL